MHATDILERGNADLLEEGQCLGEVTGHQGHVVSKVRVFLSQTHG